MAKDRAISYNILTLAVDDAPLTVGKNSLYPPAFVRQLDLRHKTRELEGNG